LRGTPGSACPQPEPNATELPSCAPISARAAQRRQRRRWWRGEEGARRPGPEGQGSVCDRALRDALCLCKPELRCFLLAIYILIPTGNAPGWLRVSYNIEIYLVTFWSMILHLTTHPAPASAPQAQPHGQQGSTKQGRRALCSAPSHHFATGRFPPRVLARISASSPRQAASALWQMQASPLRRRRVGVGRGVDWKGGEDERGWLNGDERAPRCH